MPRVWRFAPYDESLVRQMCGALRISPLMAQVLLARGYASRESALEFLDARLVSLHDPELLPGVPEAADRIVAAVRAGRRITIYGDYDVDGVTATSLLWHCLKLAGANVDYYIPCRFEEGYGLNCEALRQLHAEDPRRLLVSVDCGIASLEEAALAKQLGLELIITDHHQPRRSPESRVQSPEPNLAGLASCPRDSLALDPRPSTLDPSHSPLTTHHLPEAACLVHPRLPGSEYPFADLCGVGVAFKLAWAVCRRLGDGKKASPRMREFLKSAVGLAAIGTVADVVPLVGENRILVRYGLSALAERAAPGLQALMRVSGIESGREMQADDDIGFKIAPRLNAAGRLGQARLAVELLTTENQERAVALAQYLDELNRSRRTVEIRMFKRAKELVAEHPEWEQHRAIVLAQRDWHPGVIGIVASRIAEHFQKPAVLISLNPETNLGQGSGRSFAGLDLHGALAACSDHLVSFGGHAAAAGVRIDAGRIDDFRERFCAYVGGNHQVEDRALGLHIDAEVRLADVTHRAVLELDRLGPFGQLNDRPVFAATRVELAGPPRKMGEGERHLSLMVRQYGTTLRAIAFGRGEWADEITAVNGPIAISFAAGINRFRGRESVELQLKDWQPDPTRQ